MITKGDAGKAQVATKTWAWYLVSFILAGLMLAAVIWQADPGMLADGLRQADWPLLSLVPVFYLITLGFRAARFRLLLEPAGPPLAWYRLAALHNFYFTFVPFKLGEASFLPLARKRNVHMAQAAMALVWSRVFELIVLLVFGFVGMLGLGLGASALPLLVMLLLLSLLLLRMSWIATVLTRLARFAQARVGGDRMSNLVGAFEAGSDWLTTHRKHSYRLLLLTFGACVAASLSLAFCLGALERWFTIPEVMFLFSGLLLLGLLGVFTVAGLGISELGLAALLMLVGFSLVEATTLALLTRFFLLTATLVGTGVALLTTRGQLERGDD